LQKDEERNKIVYNNILLRKIACAIYLLCI